MIHKEINKMVKSSSKLKSAVLATTLGLFLATTSFVTTSSAATVKNGVACKKAGLKTKVGKKNYVCENNPYVTPTKLTWMLSTCKTENDNLILMKEGIDDMLAMAGPLGYDTVEKILEASDADGKKEINLLLSNISKTENRMKNTLCKRGK